MSHSKYDMALKQEVIALSQELSGHQQRIQELVAEVQRQRNRLESQQEALSHWRKSFDLVVAQRRRALRLLASIKEHIGPAECLFCTYVDEVHDEYCQLNNLLQDCKTS